MGEAAAPDALGTAAVHFSSAAAPPMLEPNKELPNEEPPSVMGREFTSEEIPSEELHSGIDQNPSRESSPEVEVRQGAKQQCLTIASTLREPFESSSNEGPDAEAPEDDKDPEDDEDSESNVGDKAQWLASASTP